MRFIMEVPNGGRIQKMSLFRKTTFRNLSRGSAIATTHHKTSWATPKHLSLRKVQRLPLYSSQGSTKGVI